MSSRHSFFLASSVLAVVLLGRVVSTQAPQNPAAAALKNPVPSTPASLAAGKTAYDLNCAGCHGPKAQGAVKAGTPISIIQEQGGKQPPDLTDAAWDHGSSDGEIFTAIKTGIPPTMMAGWGDALADEDIWNVVNYLRALAANKDVVVAPAPAAPAPDTPREKLVLADYVQMPITGELAGENTRGLLARVNFMREEPGGRRFFVNDLNGPLYILDKQTKQFTTYLDFNGLAGRPGLFARLTFEKNFATGLINFIFDPDYTHNGVFYTIHMEDPTTPAPAEPRSGVVPGLDVSGYKTTPAVVTPIQPGAQVTREAVVIEWTDRNIANATFEGTAREILRVQLASAIHPLGEFTFNPTARPGDPDWRVMYIGSGDSGSGEQKDIRRMNPQRLDNLAGKILRIIPDLREHTATSTVSENGRYRIPNDNPFVAVQGARKEIWALGLRNPHRLIWDVDPAQPRAPRLIAFVIGLTSWESVMIIKKGANYGYSLREGPQAMTLEGMTPVPADDTIPMRISDTVTRGTMKPTYPVIAYPHAGAGGDAIAGGFVYRGTRIPALKGKLVFGDITTGRIWYAEMADVLKADDGDPKTLAPMHELDAGLRRLVEDAFHKRGSRSATLPGNAAVSGRGRVDMRFAEDSAGELYVLTKSDGMIRQVVGVEPPRPRLTGVAHMAVSVSDIEQTRRFYRDWLGFQEPYDLKNADGSLNMTFFKVNEDQYIEIFPGLKPDEDRLKHVAFATDDASALRAYLAEKGVPVPAAVSRGRIGNSNFTVTDPDGRTVEFTQYEAGGWTRRESGKFLGDERISTRIMHVGILVGDATRATGFYGDVLGLREFWRGNAANSTYISWINMRLPESEDYVEYMLYSDLPAPAARGTQHHVCLEVADVEQARARLEANPYRASYTRPLEVRTGINRRRQLNLFDPDGTRIELMEPRTVDGQPPASSTLPLPPRR